MFLLSKRVVSQKDKDRIKCSLMKQSPASRERWGNIPACRVLPLRGTARTLVCSSQTLSSGAKPSAHLGLSRCGGPGERCRIPLKMQPGVPVIASWPLLRNVPNSHNSVPISWSFKVRALGWLAT